MVEKDSIYRLFRLGFHAPSWQDVYTSWHPHMQALIVARCSSSWDDGIIFSSNTYHFINAYDPIVLKEEKTSYCTMIYSIGFSVFRKKLIYFFMVQTTKCKFEVKIVKIKYVNILELFMWGVKNKCGDIKISLTSKRNKGINKTLIAHFNGA
jgi:hypothetical protein